MDKSLQIEDERSYVADELVHIEFPCHVEVCMADKHMKKFGPEKRCCVACAEHQGYCSDEDHADNLKQYEGWNDYGNGWHSPIGCLLPRQSRGVLCNTYVCDAAMLLMSQEDKQTIYDLLVEVDEYGYKKSGSDS